MMVLQYYLYQKGDQLWMKGLVAYLFVSFVWSPVMSVHELTFRP
jgi:hypothetical protein